MIVKEHKSTSGMILSVCDSKIIGKKYKEGEFVLDLSSDFYKGDECSEEETILKIKRSYMVNAVGDETITLLKKLKFIDEKNIIIIEGIPFAQCLLIQNEV